MVLDIDDELMQEIVEGCGSVAPYNEPLNETENEIFDYLMRHMWVPEIDDVNRLATNINASPELHELGKPNISSSIHKLVSLRMLEHLDLSPSGQIWILGPVTDLALRCSPDNQKLAEIQLANMLGAWRNEFLAQNKLVVHDGIAKYGGTADITEAIDSIKRGSTVRWLTFHGLSDEFIPLLIGHAHKIGGFELRILVMTENAHEDLIERAPRTSFENSVREGISRINSMRQTLDETKVKIKIRRYGKDVSEGFLRGILVTGRRDEISRLGLITMSWPAGQGAGGRGTEGVRLVLNTFGGGAGGATETRQVSSLAHLFKWYFDYIWSINSKLWLYQTFALGALTIAGLGGVIGSIWIKPLASGAILTMFGAMIGASISLLTAWIPQRMR